MINWMKKKLKRMDIWDVALIKWSTAAFVLFVITIWPAAMNWVHSVNPWIFFIMFVIFFIRPIYRIYLKQMISYSVFQYNYFYKSWACRFFMDFEQMNFDPIKPWCFWGFAVLWIVWCLVYYNYSYPLQIYFSLLILGLIFAIGVVCWKKRIINFRTFRMGL